MMLSALFALLGVLVAVYLLFFYSRRTRRTPSNLVVDSAPKSRKRFGNRVGQKFTLAEVSSHNRRDDLWLVIEGKVYDFTSFVEDHPGGDAILRYAGSDATVGFKGPQHPARVWDMIPDYFIGELESSSK